MNNKNTDFVENILTEKKHDVKQFIVKSIGKKIRKIPEIKFIFDSTEHDAARVNKIISDLKIPSKK